METPNWLLCGTDFNDRNWFSEYLPEVGIISSEYAFIHFEISRFECFEQTDCPYCNYFGKNYIMKKQKYKCKKCRKIFLLKTGTFLHDSKLDYAYWYRLCFLLCELSIPVNSHIISRNLKVPQLTAYRMLIRIKKALGYNSKGIKFKIPLSINYFELIEKLLTLKVIS